MWIQDRTEHFLLSSPLWFSFWWVFGWCKTQEYSHFLSLLSGFPERSSASEENHTSATCLGPFNVTLTRPVTRKIFITCLSSSGEHKDYCFGSCMEDFGHFTPVIHMYPGPSIQQREGRVTFFIFFCELHPFSQWMDKYAIVQFIQKTDNLIIVPMNSHRRVRPMNDSDVLASESRLLL